MCWFSKLPATNGSAAISATAFMASLGSPVTSLLKLFNNELLKDDVNVYVYITYCTV